MRKLLGMLMGAAMLASTGEMGNTGPRLSSIEEDAQRRRERAQYGRLDDDDRARIAAAAEKQERKAVKRQADRGRNGHA